MSENKEANNAVENVQVYVRVRPPNERERSNGYKTCVDIDKTTVTVATRPEPKQFTYDHVAGGDSTQDEVFQNVGKPISETCLAGYNGTIFAYGQTGSGKTYTIQGPTNTENISHRGVMPRVFEYLCAQMAREQRKAGDRLQFLCKASFLEIYNERVYDLLDPASDSLNMREDIRRGVFVDNATETTITDADDAVKVMNTGIQNRRVGETAMNRESSRSHSVYCLDIESTETKDGLTRKKHSRFHLIDLAGSERQKSTEASGNRLKEASTINKSLSALGNVIMSLVAGARSGKKTHVHYRDSKLTFLLRDSLGGNSLTYIIACISPSGDAIGETISTLKFAQRAKMIKNKAVINENESGSVAILSEENNKLRLMVRQLQALQSANSRRMSLSFVTPMSPLTKDVFTPEKKKRRISMDNNGDSLVPSAAMEAMVKQSLDREKQWMEDNKKLEKQVKDLQTLVKKHERHGMSHKLIIKLRDAAVSQLKKTLSKDSNEEVFVSDEVVRLQQEILELRSQVEHHPEVLNKAITISHLQDKLEAMEKDEPQDKSHAEYYELSRKVLDLAGEKEKMGSQLTELKDTLKSPERLLRMMPSPEKRKFESIEIKKFEAKQGFEEQLDKLKKELKDANEEAIATHALLDDHAKESSDLQLRLKASQLSNDEHRANLEAMKMRHEIEMTRSAEARMEGEVALKACYDEQLKLFEQGLQEVEAHAMSRPDPAELVALQTKLSSMEKDNKDLVVRFNASDSQVAQLKTQLNQAHTQTEELKQQFAGKISSIEGDLSSKEAELREVSSALEGEKTASESLANELEEMMADMQRARVQNASLLEEQFDSNRKLVESQSEIDRLTQLAEHSAKESDTLTFENEMLKEDHDTLLESFGYHQKATEDLNAQLADLQRELATVSQKLSKEQKKASDEAACNLKLSQQLQNIISQKSDVDSSIVQLSREKDEINDLAGLTILMHEGTIADLTASLEDLSSKFASTQTQLRDETEKTKVLVSDLESTSSAFSALQAKLIATEKKCVHNVCEMEGFRVIAEQLRSQLQIKEDQTVALRQEVNDMEQMEILAADIHKHEIETLSGKLSLLAANLRTANAELAQGRKEMERMEAEYQEAQAMHEQDLNQLMACHNDDVQGVEATLKQLQQDHEHELSCWEIKMVSEVETSQQQRLVIDQLRQALADANSNYAQLREENGLLVKRSRSSRDVLGEMRNSALNKTSEGEAQAVLQIIGEIERRAFADGAENTDETKKIVQSFLTIQVQGQKQIAEVEQQLSKSHAEMQKLRLKMEEDRAAFRAKEDVFARLSMDWQGVQQTKSEEMGALRQELAEVRAVETLLKLELQRATEKVVTLNEEHAQGVEEAKMERSQLQQKLKSTQALLESHAQDADTQTFEAARLAAQVKQLNEKLRISLQEKQSLSDDMLQIQKEEERSHQEKEQHRLRLEEIEAKHEHLKQEYAMAKKTASEMKLQIAKLTGHQNPKQKIQHHLKIKQENDQLKTDKNVLERNIQVMHKKMKAAGIEYASQDKEEAEKVDKENEKLRNQHGRLQEQLKTLTDTVVKLAAQHSDKTLSNNENDPSSTNRLSLARLGETAILKAALEDQVSKKSPISGVAKDSPADRGAQQFQQATNAISAIVAALTAEQAEAARAKRQLVEKTRELKRLENMTKLASERKIIDSLSGMLDDDDAGFVDGSTLFV